MKKIFMRGLVAIAPVAVTIALVVWLLKFMEHYASIPIKDLIGAKNYYPGMGIVVALVFIFIVGVVINNFLIQKFYSLGERLLVRIPLVASLYKSANDLMSFFQPSEGKKKQRVVMVEFNGMRLLGLVTREVFSDLAEGIASEKDVAVFLPFSYQIGGYTFLIPRKKVKPVEMSVEECMRFTMTAGAQANNIKP